MLHAEVDGLREEVAQRLAVGARVDVGARGGEATWSGEIAAPGHLEPEGDRAPRHLGAVVTFYPGAQSIEERPDVPLAPRGPCLRAGLAAAFLDSSPDEEDQAPPGSAGSHPSMPTWHAKGLGFTAGCGWAWRLGKRTDWTFELSLDMAWDQFHARSDPTAPDGAFGFKTNVGITFF